MQIKVLVSAAAIALGTGVGSASADENFDTLDGISAFDSLAGIQAVPLDIDELSAISGSDFVIWDRKGEMWVEIDVGHWSHDTHVGGHGIKGTAGGGGVQ